MWGNRSYAQRERNYSAFTFDLARALRLLRLLFFLPIDHFRYMVLCAFNRCLQWNLLEQCTRAAARRCAKQGSAGDVCSSSGLACYLHFMYSNCDIYKHTHTHILSLFLSHSHAASLSFSFPSLLPLFLLQRRLHMFHFPQS